MLIHSSCGRIQRIGLDRSIGGRQTDTSLLVYIIDFVFSSDECKMTVRLFIIDLYLAKNALNGKHPK